MFFSCNKMLEVDLSKFLLTVVEAVRGLLDPLARVQVVVLATQFLEVS